MNNKISIIFFTLCTLTLSACSTTNNSISFTPAATNNDKAVVYIYRPTVMSNAIYSPDLLVNDEVKFSLKVGKKYLLNLPPGDTVFEIEPDKAYTGVTQLKMSLKSNNRYYLRIDTTLKLNNSTSYETYKRGFSLVVVDEISAVAEITACCSTKIKKLVRQADTESITDNENTGNSFSVDKTQNPFSH